MAELDGRLFRRVGNRLSPEDFAAEEMLEAIKDNDCAVIFVRKADNSDKSRNHWFLLLHAALDHLEGFQDEDSLSDAIKVAVGHTRPIHKLDGEIIFLPKSISKAAMKEAEFQRFKNRGIYVLNQLLGFDIVEHVEQKRNRNR